MPSDTPSEAHDPGPGQRALVSVCIPVFNSGELAVRAVQSALDQDYPAVEVLVVDDASTDGTPALLQARFGNDISLFVNERNRGHTKTANLTIARSRGELVKFLDHDDLLEQQCVSRMVAVLEDCPSAGFVFSRRKIEVATREADGWLERYRNVHEGFRQLARVNGGRELLEQLLENELRDNWIGEPSCVMVRRSALDTVGGFNTHVYSTPDLDLWARLMTRFDVAFVDEELSTYRHSATSETARTHARRLNWLDRLWTLDTLAHDPAIGDSIKLIEPQLRAQRRLAFRAAALQTFRRQPHNLPLRLWWNYQAIRIRRAASKRSRNV